MKTRWATAIGAWGDIIAAVGNILALQLPEPVGIIHYGVDPHIATWLKEQGLFREVLQLKPRDRAEYLAFISIASDPRVHAEAWLPQLLQGTGINWQEVSCTHTRYIQHPMPVHHWRHPKLPQRSLTWARTILSELEIDGDFWLLNPVSTQSTTREIHWPWWEEAIEWLTEHENRRLVWVGQGYSAWYRHPNLHNLIGLTPSMMEVFALAELSRGIITTSNCLELWAVISQKPALCCHNQTMSQDNFFRRWILDPINLIVEHGQNLCRFKEIAQKFWQVTDVPCVATREKKLACGTIDI